MKIYTTIREEMMVGALLVLLGALTMPVHADALSASDIVERFCGSSEKILVTTFDDHEDADGCTAEDCTLREAVNAANLCPYGRPAMVQLRDGSYELKYVDYLYYFNPSGNYVRYAYEPDPHASPSFSIRGDIRIYGDRATTIRPREGVEYGLLSSNAFVVAQGARLNLRKNLSIENFSYGVARVREGGYLTLNRVTLRNNRGGLASILTNRGDTRVVNSTVAENRATDASYIIANSGFMKITSSTISGNHVTGSETINCIVANAGKMVLLASTVSGNRYVRGAICADGDTRIVDSTIVNNTFTVAAELVGTTGAVSVDDRVVTALEISNTIIANNSPLDCAFPATGLPSAAHRAANLDSDGSCAAIPELDFRLSMDPVLEPLAYNKGPTQTHMPVLGSPVIDAGDACNSHDQRAQARPVDGDFDLASRCDMGAVEYVPDYGLYKEKLLNTDCPDPSGYNCADTYPAK